MILKNEFHRLVLTALLALRAQVTDHLDVRKSWIWDKEEIQALQTVIDALEDCADPTPLD